MDRIVQTVTKDDHLRYDRVMNDDETKELRFARLLDEKWSGDLQKACDQFRATCDQLSEDSTITPAIVAGLIHTAIQLASEKEDKLGSEFFERSVQHVLAGFDGMRIVPLPDDHKAPERHTLEKAYIVE